MKIIITESQYSKSINYYITHCLEPHEIKTNERYPDSVFWIKDGKVIVQIEKSKYFWLQSKIWNNISNMFNLDYDDIQSHLSMWLEEHYGLGKLIPYTDPLPFFDNIVIWGN